MIKIKIASSRTRAKFRIWVEKIPKARGKGSEKGRKVGKKPNQSHIKVFYLFEKGDLQEGQKGDHRGQWTKKKTRKRCPVTNGLSSFKKKKKGKGGNQKGPRKLCEKKLAKILAEAGTFLYIREGRLTMSA